MAKNQTQDLNNHLFAALERLGNEDLEGEKLLAEIERCKAVTAVASQVVNMYRAVIDAATVTHEHRLRANPLTAVSASTVPAIEGPQS